MLFSEKYPDAKPKEVLEKDSLLVSENEKPCSVCGRMTHFIDYCGETRLCSEECSSKLWRRITVDCSDFPSEFPYKELAYSIEDFLDAPSMKGCAKVAEKVAEIYKRNQAYHPSRVPLLAQKAASLAPQIPVFHSDEAVAKYLRERLGEIIKVYNKAPIPRYVINDQLARMYAALIAAANWNYNPDKIPMSEVVQTIKLGGGELVK